MRFDAMPVVNVDYKDTLKKSLTTLMMKYSPSAKVVFDGNPSKYAAWPKDANFRKLCAAIDMFLFRFSLNPYAVIRWGTVVCRYKDCSALNSLHYFAGLIGKEVHTASLWFWNQSLFSEINNLMEEPTESQDPYSYFAYFMDLGLSNKSPYSAVYNPNVHMFFHVFGSILKG